MSDSQYLVTVALALVLNPVAWFQIYRLRSETRTWRLKAAMWGASLYSIAIVIPLVLLVSGYATVNGGVGIPDGLTFPLVYASIGAALAAVLCGLVAPWRLRIPICVGGGCTVAFWVFTRFGVL